MNRVFVCVASAVAAVLAMVALSQPASASETSASESSISQLLGNAATPAGGPSQASASTSGATASGRRKPPRLMPIWLAQSKADSLAKYIYLDPEQNWTDYGVRHCTRVNRSKVSCYTYVIEDLYDTDGYYYDSELCDWFTVSYYPLYGKLKIWTSKPECVYLSEV